MQTSGKVGIFISLKWKALFLTSLVLLLVTSAFVTLNYLELQNQFNERREDLQRQYSVQVQALVNQFSNRLLMLSTFMASLQSTQAVFDNSHQKKSLENFESLRYGLELNMGMEIVTIVTANGNKLIQKNHTDKVELNLNIFSAVSAVLATEKPTTVIDCSFNCLQYAIAPILSHEGVLGAIVIGASLADVILDFKGVSGTDIGLIVQSQPPTKILPRWLDPWNSNVVALTNSNINFALLRSIAYAHRNLDSIYNITDYTFQGRQYHFRIFPLAGFNQTDKAYLAIIADITDAIQHINDATNRSIIIGISGFFISEIFLLIILWKPMSSLRRSTEYLPLLADGEFDKVRMAILTNKGKRIIGDEVDVLNETAISLTLQLESLNLEIANRMDDVIRERNFVNNILDTAQAIILTQNSSQNITMVNSYGCTLMGYTQNELKGVNFNNISAIPGH